MMTAMPNAAVTIWFDYACPHSYHALGQLEELAPTLGLEIDRRPFLMRSALVEDNPDTSAPVDVPVGARRQPLYRPGHGSGTEPASNRSLSTLAIHAATAYAKELGLDARFYWAASREYWERGTDLETLYTIRRLALSIGLDWEEMWPKLDSGRYHSLVLAQHEEALETGVVQTPSFRFGGTIGGRFYVGPMDAEEFRSAVCAAQ